MRLPRSCGLFPGNQERTPRHFRWGPTVQRSHRGSLCASGESSELRQQSFSAPKGVMPMQGTVRRASCPRSNVETPGETGGEIARGEARPEREVETTRGSYQRSFDTCDLEGLPPASHKSRPFLSRYVLPLERTHFHGSWVCLAQVHKPAGFCCFSARCLMHQVRGPTSFQRFPSTRRSQHKRQGSQSVFSRQTYGWMIARLTT